MNSMLRLIQAMCILLLSSFSACLLSAQQADNPRILRSVYADFYPYSYTAEDGSARGYSIDLTRQLVKQAGYEVQFFAADNPHQFLDMLEAGQVDLTPLLALTPARRAVGLATSMLGQYELSVYVRGDREITTVAELSGLKIGAVDGAITFDAARMIPFVEVVAYQTEEEILLPLMNGELDAVVGVAEPFEARLRANFIKDKVRRLKPSLTVIPYGLIVRRELPQVHSALEKAIAHTATHEKLTALQAHWFGRDRRIFEHPWFRSVAMIVGGTSMAMIALGIYAVRLRRRSARLLAKNGENQLLIDALDQMRAGVVIFDRAMRAVHWNKGFEASFPSIVPELRKGATIEKTCHFAYRNKLAVSSLSRVEMTSMTNRTIEGLKSGNTEQRIMETPQGATFELSMFRLGTGHYAAIWVDVTQLHQQRERIASQSHELTRKNEQLQTFSAMAAHDLKAPLVQQTALLEFILEDVADAQITLPPEALENFTTLTDLSCRMSHLVSDLLNYAKADNDLSQPDCFSPNARLESIQKLLGTNSHFNIVVAPDMPAVRVDPRAFDMVLRNLISNGIKHHDRLHGQIEIKAFSVNGMVVIVVCDDGPGIDPEEHEAVFEPFCRLTNVEGTGLGLAFVKKTVAAWGGAISIRSTGERGCAFEVSIPASPVNLVTLKTELRSNSIPDIGQVRRGISTQ